MEKEDTTLTDIVELVSRIKEQEEYRAEGVVLFRDRLVLLDSISKTSDTAEQSALLNITIDALKEYLSNIIAYNQKQDEMLDGLLDVSGMDGVSN